MQRAIVIGMEIDVERDSIFHSPNAHVFTIAVNKIRAEAAAWVRKYFVAASMARGWGILVIIGIIANVLISRPIHASTQWWLESVIVVPVAKLERKMNRASGDI